MDRQVGPLLWSALDQSNEIIKVDFHMCGGLFPSFQYQLSPVRVFICLYLSIGHVGFLRRCICEFLDWVYQVLILRL